MKKSIFLFFAAILCAFSVNVQAADLKGGEVVLLKPGTNWKKDGARFAVYFFNNSTSKNQWVSMKAVEGETGVYYAVAPTGTWKNLIYARMNPGNSANNWDTRWNQSADLTWSNTNSLFTVADGTWDSATKTWSVKKVTSQGKLVASSANVSENEAVTLTPSLTTNTAINTILSTEYTISPATGASVSDNTFTATAAGTYTVTATIKYRLNGYTSTSFESTVDAKTTITVASAAEPKHDVTVTWMSGTTELQPSQTLSVGESTGYPVEAPEFKDYTFSGWTLGTGVQSTNETANPINITTKASGEYTLVANYDYIEPVIKTIYCKMEHNWWAKDGAAISAYISGTYGESTGVGSLMTLAPLESNVWKIDIDVARYQKVKFIRVSPDGASNWGAHTGLVEIPTDDKNLYTITQTTDKWGSDCPGTWSVYEAPATAPKRYITGSKELVGGEGWKANEIEMTYDNSTSTYSHTFLASALTAGTEYKLKVTEGNWDGGKWGTINGTIPGVSNDGDGNVCFTLKTAGDVTITFDGSKITVSTTGEFKVPVVYPYYILGTMNSWSVKEEYGLADEDEDGVYTREITLAAGSHYFKINIGKWDSQWGWSNVTGKYAEATDAKDDNKIKITLASEKTFVVEFNKSNNQISFDGLTTNEDYYTVVGVAELFGTAWAPANEANKMVKQGDGSYKLVKENVTLAAIGYDWKIAKNGDWWNDAATGVNPSTDKNNTLTITTAGRYNVTFTLAADLKTAKVETELLEAAVVIPDCFISGNKNLTGEVTEWQGNEFTMVYDEETETWSYTLPGLQPEKAYELKVVCGGTWYNYTNLASVPTGVTEGNDHSIAFKMAAAGDVTVTYNIENGITISGNFYVAPTYDYYIAGTLAGGWSATQQGMIKDGDLYKAIFSELPANTYQFKITDGQWNTEEDKTHEFTTLGAAYEEVSYNEGNIKIVTEEAINLTVIFDAAAGEITFEGLTEKTINYVDIKFTITANSAPQIHYWGDGITGTDWNNLPSMTPTGNPNEYTFTIEGVDQEKGVNYLLKIGELQTADQSTKTDVVADFKDLLPLISIYGIVDWNAANAIHLTIADDYATATANIELAAETTYEFKVNIGAKWLGNVSTMTSDNCTGWTFAEKNGEEDMPNAGITTTIAGEYTFTWNVADNKLSVTYPTPLPATYTRTVTSGNFGTICLPYAGAITGATLFVLSYKDENYVYVDEIGTTLEAGKPYLFLPTSTEITVNYTDNTYKDAGENGALRGTYVEMNNAALMGKYIISGNKYYLIDNATGNSRLPENRAYFVLDDVSPSEPVLAPGARRIALGTNGQNTATGMENVDASAQPVKTIINGQLFILRGEKMYDAQGKLVK